MNAPVAQWIERWPPEPEAQVRVLSGVLYKNQSEPILLNTTTFLQQLSFPQSAELMRLSNKFQFDFDVDMEEQIPPPSTKKYRIGGHDTPT